MTIQHEDIKGIKLYENYRTFCDKQDNCIECSLNKANVINSNCYDQPCAEVYDLLCIIRKLEKDILKKNK